LILTCQLTLGFGVPGQVRIFVQLQVYFFECLVYFPNPFLLTINNTCYSTVRQRQFGYSLFPAHKLIGKCQDLGPNKKVHGVCTEEARFQEALIGLGKTSMSTTDEMQYFLSSEKKPENLTVISQMKVFVYDIAQVEDKDEERSQLFMDDMQTFLQMTEPFKPMGQRSGGKTKQSRIDICEQKYDHLREALLDIGVNASRWIRRFFVPAEGVTVSSPKFFEQSLAKWEIDPCEERRANNTFPPK
jgi:hypothetical protein